MDRYLREFQTDAEYEVFTGTSEYLLPNVSWCVESNHVHMKPYKHDNPKDYLTFTATEAGTFKFSGNSVDYSLNNGTTWTTLASNTNSPTVQAGSSIMWKATLTPTSSVGIGRFSSTGSFVAKGNPMSLLYGDNFNGQTDLTGKNYAFYGLFSGCTGLTNSDNLSLPATTLANYCYGGMFGGCTNLTTAPELPATTLATYCYYGMFQGCTSLTTAPEIPKNMNGEISYENEPTMIESYVLPSNCLSNMFSGCSSLNKIMFYSWAGLQSSCSNNWVKGVAATGDFYTYHKGTAGTAGDSTRPSAWTYHFYSSDPV